MPGACAPRRTAPGAILPPNPAAEGGQPPFPYIGARAAVLRELITLHPEIEAEALASSDVCHTVVKRLTCPPGYRYTATLINAEKRWYTH